MEANLSQWKWRKVYITRSTCIADLSGRATSTALQPQKPTWNQQDSDRENCLWTSMAEIF